MCADRRFTGDECDICASDHYGDTCGKYDQIETPILMYFADYHQRVLVQ